MANWYGIEGTEFHFNGPLADPEITFNGVRDDSLIDVENTMWEWFNEEVGTGNDNQFHAYMRDNADEVKELILMARGELEY